MRAPSLVLGAVFAVYGLAACHHKTPPPAAPAAAAPTPPPAAPPPATAPAAQAPAVNEYMRLAAMDLESINRLGLLEDAHFEFDRADLDDRAQAALRKDAEVLKRFDFLTLTIEGHCDERGTVEYNLALGDRRARAAHDYLVSLGVPGGRLKTVSYGKESPQCREHAEDCWARNRRARPVVTGKLPLP
jgi:peptidoglycan-associated lipoprotein